MFFTPPRPEQCRTLTKCKTGSSVLFSHFFRKAPLSSLLPPSSSSSAGSRLRPFGRHALACAGLTPGVRSCCRVRIPPSASAVRGGKHAPGGLPNHAPVLRAGLLHRKRFAFSEKGFFRRTPPRPPRKAQRTLSSAEVARGVCCSVTRGHPDGAVLTAPFHF